MATLQSTQEVNRTANPITKNPQQDTGGRQRTMYADYTTTGNLGATDLIQFGQLPAGARVTGFTLKVPALGGSCAGTLGWGASSDGVEAASAAGLLASSTLVSAINYGTTSAASAGLFKKFSSPVIVQLQLSAASAGGAGQVIGIAVHYTLD